MSKKTSPDPHCQPNDLQARLLRTSESGPQFRATYCSASHYLAADTPPPLTMIMAVEEGDLSDTAHGAIRLLEDGSIDGTTDRWRQFKWNVLALLAIQDVFDVAVLPGGGQSAPHTIWYFYYEAKFLLIEAILSGLNGLPSASHALLRPILEFHLLQTYHYRTAQDNTSYAPLKRYFASGISPNWNSVLKGCLPRGGAFKPVRRRLQAHLDALSRIASHPHRPDASYKHDGCISQLAPRGRRDVGDIAARCG